MPFFPNTYIDRYVPPPEKTPSQVVRECTVKHGLISEETSKCIHKGMDKINENK